MILGQARIKPNGKEQKYSYLGQIFGGWQTVRLANLFCTDTFGVSFRKLLLYAETPKRAAKNASSKRYYPTQALNATTNGGIKAQAHRQACNQCCLRALLAFALMPDAGRVAPISVSVWCQRLVLAFGACIQCLRLVLAFGVSVWCLHLVLAFSACVQWQHLVLALGDCVG